MSNLFIGIGAWIKGHVVATVVISTVVVSGAVATPIIVNNIQEQNKPQETVKQPETNNNNNEEEQPITCKDGYELVDNECVKVENEENKVEEQPKEPTNSDKPSTNTTKPDNKPTNTEKPTETEPEQKPEPEQPKEQGLVVSGHSISYNGTSLVTVSKVATVFTLDNYIETVSYNSNAISSLPSNIKNDVANNLCKITYKGCFYSEVFDRNVPEAIKSTNNYNYQAYWLGDTAIRQQQDYKNQAESCRDQMKNGTYTYTDYNDDYCSAIDGFTAEVWNKKVAEREKWIENAKIDKGRYQNSYNDFTALWNLLTK